MRVALCIGLLLIEIVLFLAKKRISAETLQRLADAWSVVAAIAAVLMLVVPAPAPPSETPQPTNTSTPSVTPLSASTLLSTATPDCSLATELGPWPSGSIVHLDARNGWIQADFWSSDRPLLEGYDEVSVLLEPGLEVEFVGVGGNGWEYGHEWNRQNVDWCIEKHIRDSWNIRHKKLIYITLAELCATIECR